MARIVRQSGLSWALPRNRDWPLAVRVYGGDPADGASRLRYDIAKSHTTIITPRWGLARALDDGKSLLWIIFRPLVDGVSSCQWDMARRKDASGRIPWGVYAYRHSDQPTASWAVSVRRDATDTLPWGVALPVPDLAKTIIWGISAMADVGRTLRWSTVSQIIGRPVGVVIEQDGPAEVTPDGTIVVPVRRVYMIVNTGALRRLSDSLPLRVLDMTVQIDADSWAWSLSATLAADDYANVSPTLGGDPQEVEAEINGWLFRFVVENVSRTRKFGQHAVRIAGRSLSAWLAAPYALPATHSSAVDRTAQQLADDALLYTGWTLDWQITDWLVTAGAWSHQGTPIEAVTRIAGAAGAVVQTDPTLQVLHVLPRYPLMPWEWAAGVPDVSVPPDILTEDATELRERPASNAVYVAGTTQGVIGHVKRTGTAGDIVAPMITDALTTHADAARQRGRSILGDTGRQHRVIITLPLTVNTDLLTPGQLIEITEGAGWRGIARGLTVTARREGETLRVRQRVEVEKHD